MSRIAYVNGRYRPLVDACVNVEDRGYQFGDAIYEVVHLHAGRLVDEDRHMARLDRSLGEIRLSAPMGAAALGRVVREVARRNRLRDGLIYIQVGRGVARRDHAFPSPAVAPSLVVTARRLPAFPVGSPAWTGTAITCADQRWARCDIKSTNLLPNVLARQAARERGATEAILLRDGMVTEGASTTVWAVDEAGTLRTRHLDAAVLPGCTRAVVADLLAEWGIAFEERGLSEADLRAAREVFVTSATSFVKAMTHIDGQPVGNGRPGPVTRIVFDMFTQHVRGARVSA